MSGYTRLGLDLCGEGGRVVPIEVLAREVGIKQTGLRQGELWDGMPALQRLPPPPRGLERRESRHR